MAAFDSSHILVQLYVRSQTALKAMSDQGATRNAKKKMSFLAALEALGTSRLDPLVDFIQNSSAAMKMDHSFSSNSVAMWRAPILYDACTSRLLVRKKPGLAL